MSDKAMSCTHTKDPRTSGQCKHCQAEVYFNCTRCGPIEAAQEIVKVPITQGYRGQGRVLRYEEKAQPLDRCPKCAGLLWEVVAWYFTDKQTFQKKPQRLRNTAREYRRLIAAAGCKPGKAIKPFPEPKPCDAAIRWELIAPGGAVVKQLESAPVAAVA